MINRPQEPEKDLGFFIAKNPGSISADPRMPEKVDSGAMIEKDRPTGLIWPTLL